MPEKREHTISLAIAIPTYNEAKNIVNLTQQIKATLQTTSVTCTVLIIDDNSPDGTGAVADALARQENSKKFAIKVLHRKGKEGLGKAYVAGFTQLLHNNYTHILQMDADLSHNPVYIPALLEEAKKVDFVVGSRYIAGGDTPDWSLARKLLSRFGNIYARCFLGSKIHDYTGGYNLYSAALLQKVNLDTLQAGGYGFLIELKYRALRNCKAVNEVPIVFMDRMHGVSKIPRSTILKNLILIPSLALKPKGLK